MLELMPMGILQDSGHNSIVVSLQNRRQSAMWQIMT